MADVPPPPPPPENPFFNAPNGDEGAGETLDAGAPNVAAKPGRVLLVLGVVGSIVAVLVLTIFSGGDKAAAPVQQEKPRAVAPALEPPPLPSTPAPLNIAPVTIPEPAKIDLIDPKEDAAAKQQALARMRSKMLLADGGSQLSDLMDTKKETAKPLSNDVNSGFEANVINANTKADRVEATNIGQLNRTIAQGRLIHATMESALNTDLPAPIRAIVSRDTYGESGRVALIPKGSRLIGTYSTDISGAQSRVFVIWTRVIRPDGVDVMINSPLVDAIGQAGIGGQVDTKFQSIFSRSVLSSIVAIGTAMGSDEISGGSTTTTNSAVGGSSTTGDAATTATVNALNRLGGVSDNFIQRFLEMRPTILVDQGTVVNVFVNRDLVFPESVSGVRVIN